MKGLDKIVRLVSRLVIPAKTVDLDSSALKKVSYKKATETLRVYFVHGGVYEYSHVSEKAFDDLLQSPSAGKYFVQEIRNSYPFNKVS